MSTLPAATEDLPLYNGSCHCGTVKFQFRLKEPLDTYKVIECNCSICSIKGYQLAFPKDGEINFLQGEHSLSRYVWGKKQLAHRFCSKASSPFCECDFSGW